jgi:hypothetical protein
VINWKELADQHTSDELLLQVDQALEHKPESAPNRADDGPMTDWADGPGAAPANDTGDDIGDDIDAAEDVEGAGVGETEEAGEADDDTPFDYAARFNLGYDEEDDEFDEDDAESDDGSMPRPSFGSLTSIGGIRKTERAPVLPEVPEDERVFAEIDLENVHADLNGLGNAGYADGGDADDAEFEPAAMEAEPLAPIHADTEAVAEPFAEIDADPVVELELAAIDPSEMELGDWLAAAREMAAAARTSEDRTRTALYEAIGRAYDFSLAAQDRPEDFEEIVVDSGLTVQDRAPMTPVVKLVFGADYDKTRLTEYAAALSHAHRLELPRGTLGDYLRQAEGGLKGVVQAERRMRRVDSGKDAGEDPREALAARLRGLEAIALADIDPTGAEFGLVMIRRSEDGTIDLIGEVPEDATLLERAAKKLVG